MIKDTQIFPTLKFFLLLFLIFIRFPLMAEEKRVSPLVAIGVGYLDTRKCSGWLAQVEYKSGSYLWRSIRPQADLMISHQGSTYLSCGLGWEWYFTKHIVLTPSFSPGIYIKGKGRDLGHPLEFRSAIELAYEMKNYVRLGAQLYHVSNAHLSPRNPGYNALILSLSFPLQSH